MKEKRRGSFLVLVASATTLLFYLLMAVPAGWSPPVHREGAGGFYTAMGALQMSRTPEELRSILGDPATPEGERVRAALLHVNRFDFAFMAGYTALFASLIVMVGILHRSRGGGLFASTGFLNLALLLLLPLLMSDVMENLRTFPLLASPVAPGSILPDGNLVAALHFWSRLKWGLLAMESLFLGVGLAALRGRPVWLLALSFLYNTAAVFMIMAIFFSDASSLVEPGGLLLGLGWFGSTLHAMTIYAGKFS